jgi:hypothetical protein
VLAVSCTESTSLDSDGALSRVHPEPNANDATPRAAKDDERQANRPRPLMVHLSSGMAAVVTRVRMGLG